MHTPFLHCMRDVEVAGQWCHRLVAVLLIFCCLESTFAQDLQEAVPSTLESPHIDGEVDLDEWSSATVITLSDAGDVLLARDAEHLYVALRLHSRGFGSLCVQKDEQVRVLHASAALGTAVYTQMEDTWQLVEPFDFTMREADHSTGLQQKRTDFLETHGWVASTVDMEGNETASILEYKIRLDGFDPERPVLDLVAMMLEPSPDLVRIPANLDDGCADVELVRGFAPEKEPFNPAGWLRLDLGMQGDD